MTRDFEFSELSELTTMRTENHMTEVPNILPWGLHRVPTRSALIPTCSTHRTHR